MFSYMQATHGNMHGCPWVIRYHPVILAPFPTPESARFGLCIDRHAINRPLQDELVYNPISYMWATFGNMRGFPMQANFFAVIISPNTRAGAAGVIKTQKSVQKTDKTRRNPEKNAVDGLLIEHAVLFIEHAVLLIEQPGPSGNAT